MSEVPEEKQPVMYRITLRKSLVDFYLDSPHSGVELKYALENAERIEPPMLCYDCHEPLGSNYFQDVSINKYYHNKPNPPADLTKSTKINLCPECHKKVCPV